MNLTEEQLKELETLSGLFFSTTEIITILGVPTYHRDEFEEIILYNPYHPATKAYHRGRLKSLVQLRQSIKQAAINGSNPAQMEMIKFFNKSKI